MKNIDEIRAEIFRRSDERIKKRKRRRTVLLSVCIPVTLCAGFAAAFFVRGDRVHAPITDFQTVDAQNTVNPTAQSAESFADFYEKVPATVSGSSTAKDTQELQGFGEDEPTYDEDVPEMIEEPATHGYLSLELDYGTTHRKFEDADLINTVSDILQTYVDHDEISDEMMPFQAVGEESVNKTYCFITLISSDGEKAVYTLDGNVLISEYGAWATLPKDALDDLTAALGGL